MKHIILKTSNGKSIRFKLYEKEAPLTCEAFAKILPFQAKAIQAREAGEEIWIPDGPELNMPPENATVHLLMGELGIAPNYTRNQVARSIAIIYGEAKLHDCVNVFAKVFDEDVKSLKKLGEEIWLKGSQVLTFKIIN
ncbi:MAG: DUF3830 family protein [Patescibacteria group bacterium]